MGVALGPLAARAAELQAQGATVSAMVERTRAASGGSVDTQSQAMESYVLRALMAFGDEPKAGAKDVLAALRARGIKAVMISGDNRGAAEAMARRLGLHPEAGEVLAEVLPGDKAALVAGLKAGTEDEHRRASPGRLVHTVAMVGDGVNDAPALAAADVGLAMGNGTDSHAGRRHYADARRRGSGGGGTGYFTPHSGQNSAEPVLGLCLQRGGHSAGSTGLPEPGGGRCRHGLEFGQRDQQCLAA